MYFIYKYLIHIVRVVIWLKYKEKFLSSFMIHVTFDVYLMFWHVCVTHLLTNVVYLAWSYHMTTTWAAGEMCHLAQTLHIHFRYLYLA